MPLSPGLQKRLTVAVQKGDVEAYFQALNEGADPHAPTDGNGNDLLLEACKGASMVNRAQRGQPAQWEPSGDHLTIVEHLMHHVGLLPHPEHEGLLHASRHGHEALVVVLINAGFDPTAFNNRVLELAVDSKHEGTVRALLVAGADLDAGKGCARQTLTQHFHAQAQSHVHDHNLEGLESTWDNARSFGVELNANALLGTLVLSNYQRITRNREGEIVNVEQQALSLVDALVAKGAWHGSEPGVGPNGRFIAFAAKNGSNLLLDRFVSLGADPRTNDDDLLLIAARNNQRVTVDHLVAHHGASLDAQNGGVRAKLKEQLQISFEQSAGADRAKMVAEHEQAKAWGIELAASHAFHNAMVSIGREAQANALWLADHFPLPLESLEEALRTHVAMGDVERAQAWVDRLTAHGEPLRDVVQETALILAARKGHVHAIEWLQTQGVDVIEWGPKALQDIANDSSKETTSHWLSNRIEQAQLRQVIDEQASTNALTAAPRRRL